MSDGTLARKGTFNSAHSGSCRMKVRRPRRRVTWWIPIAALAAVVVSVAVVLLTRSPPWDLTGVHVTAPSGGCWEGTVAVRGTIWNVTGCGSQVIRVACPPSDPVFYVSVAKADAGTWALRVDTYVGGALRASSATEAPFGPVILTQPC